MNYLLPVFRSTHFSRHLAIHGISTHLITYNFTSLVFISQDQIYHKSLLISFVFILEVLLTVAKSVVWRKEKRNN